MITKELQRLRDGLISEKELELCCKNAAKMHEKDDVKEVCILMGMKIYTIYLTIGRVIHTFKIDGRKLSKMMNKFAKETDEYETWITKTSGYISYIVDRCLQNLDSI